MEKFTVLRGAAAPLLIDDINTDQIAPVQFMRALEPDYQTALFARWRSDPKEPFVLDMPRFKRAPILVTGANFGCGSAREVAVWAIAAHGVRCIIARSFSEIYRESLIKNGMLPIVLAPADHSGFIQQVLVVDGRSPFEIDLHARTISCPDGATINFNIEAGERKMLLEGLDDVAITLKHRLLIEAWESRVAVRQPWLQQVNSAD